MGKPNFIKIGPDLVSISDGIIMGILNATPDSFYAQSRLLDLSKLHERIDSMVKEGVDILDVGAVSSRPGAHLPDQDEEWTRLEPILKYLAAHFPDLPVSLDTFRSVIAKRAVLDYGVKMINDISSGRLDKEMPGVIADLGIPVILMHMKGLPETMQENPEYLHVVNDVITDLNKSLRSFAEAGVHDIIVDPGFGFGKSIVHNFQILKNLCQFSILERPLLVGVSRKSMIYKTLEVEPQDALNGTSVLHTLARLNGADILRTHDIKAARQCLQLVNAIDRS